MPCQGFLTSGCDSQSSFANRSIQQTHPTNVIRKNCGTKPERRVWVCFCLLRIDTPRVVKRTGVSSPLPFPETDQQAIHWLEIVPRAVPCLFPAGKNTPRAGGPSEQYCPH